MIPFAFENWSEHYQWWVPNNWPRDFKISGESRLPYSHDWMWFDHGGKNSLPHGDLAYLDLPAYKPEIMQDYRDIRFVHLDTVQDRRYIYPIFLRTWDYFAKMRDYGLRFVSESVLQDVRQNRARIVFLHPWEGTACEIDWQILDQWCKDCDLAPHQVHFIHGNWRAPGAGYQFSYHPVSMFQQNWPRVYERPIAYEPVDDRDLYVTYNRGERRHRTLLVCELFYHGLDHRGLISYHDPRRGTAWHVNRYDRPDLLPTARYLDSLPREQFQLDYDLGKVTPVFELTEQHHGRTLINVVTETLTEAVMQQLNGQPAAQVPLFFTEKTWKPIAIGQPWMIISTQGHLAKMKEWGYQSFDRWWSEEYDTVADVDTKLMLIIKELSRLNQLSRQQLIQLRAEMQPTLEHNQQLYNSYRARYQDQYWEPLYEIVDGIWRSLQ